MTYTCCKLYINPRPIRTNQSAFSHFQSIFTSRVVLFTRNMELETETRERCRTFKAKLGPIEINLNPVVSIVSAAIIWGLMVWSIVDTERAAGEMAKGKRWITETFTWFFVINQNIWFIFLMVIYFSKYGSMKLGRDDEEPEFSDVSYFTMLFSSGIGISLFYYGVADPIYYYEPGKYGNRFWNRYVEQTYSLNPKWFLVHITSKSFMIVKSTVLRGFEQAITKL